MPKSRVSKGTGILLQQLLDLKGALNEMKEGVNHDYSSGNSNEGLKKAYNLFQTRKFAFKKQLTKLKGELTDKEYADVKALVNGNLDKVKDETALLNKYVAPAYKGGDVKGWSDFSKEELKTLILDDYKLAGIGGVKFANNNKHISAMKERLANPIKLKEVSFGTGEEPKRGGDPPFKNDKGEDISRAEFTKQSQKKLDVMKEKSVKKKKGASGGAKAEVDEDFFYDGTQSATQIEALSREQKDLIKELIDAYDKQENPDKIYSVEYSNLRIDPRFKGIDVETMEKMLMIDAKQDTKKAEEKEMLRKVGEVKQAQQDRKDVKGVLEGLVSGVEMSIEDIPAPDVVKDADAPYLSVGTEDPDPDVSVSSTTTTVKTKATIATINTKQQDGTNSEYTLGDTTIVGGESPLNTPRGNPPDADPYSKPVDVSAMDIDELRARLQSQGQTEVEKAVKTGVFQGFGTVPEVVVEEVSRTSGEMPSTPQEAVNMPTGNEVEEEKARNKKDIERLKEEIRGLHKTFDVLIPALREKPHQLRFKLAMSSKDKKVVMKHHAEMMERVRLYFGGGAGNGLKVGVVVPLDSYMSSFFSGVNSGEGDISNITKQPQPKGEHQARGSGGKIVAKSIYYQRGGMSAVKGQSVSGHQVPSTLIRTRRGKIADPLQVVDAPYEYVLNRKGASSKAVSGLKIKSRK